MNPAPQLGRQLGPRLVLAPLTSGSTALLSHTRLMTVLMRSGVLQQYCVHVAKS